MDEHRNLVSRRAFLRLIGATTAVGALAACGAVPVSPSNVETTAVAEAPAATPTLAPTPEPTVPPNPNTKVTLSLWHGWTGADNTTMLNQVLATFNQQNTDGITIQPTALGWDTFFSKWVLSAAAGNPPDVAMYHTSELPEFAARGITYPIDDFIQTVGLNFEGVPETVLAASSWEGKRYAVTGDVHPLGMYYNVDLATKAELDASKPPTTREEFLDWAQKLTVKDSSGKVSQYGVHLPSEGAIPRWLWFSLLHQNGGSFLDASGKSAADSEASRAALQFLGDLIHTHKVAAEASVDTGADPVAAGQVGIWFSGPWEVNQRMNQKLNFATAPLPVIGSQPAAWVNTHCLSLSKQRDESKYEAGMTFIKWFYDNYALPAKLVGIIPVSPAARNSDEFAKDERYKYYRAFVDQLDHLAFEPSIPQYSAIFSFGKPTPLVTNIEAVLTKAKTVDQASKDLKQGLDTELARPIS